MTYKELSEELDRSKKAVKERCYILGLRKSENRRWTEEELEFLIDVYEIMSMEEIAEALERSKVAVKDRYYRLGLKEYENRRWTEGEERFLKSEFGRMTYKELSNVLGRSENAIQNHCFKLGLTKKPNFENDSDTHKTCRNCLQVLPKNKEFFYKNKNSFLVLLQRMFLYA